MLMEQLKLTMLMFLLEDQRHKAGDLLKKEMSIRREITPGALIPITERLIDQAEGSGCGARFTGAGAGGSVWALGSLEKIQRLESLWRDTLKTVKTAKILECSLDSEGVM